MATVEQYKSGDAAKAVKIALAAMQADEKKIAESQYADLFTSAADELAPIKLNETQAADYIDQAEKCAVGDRVCLCEFPDSPHTESVFLDELAEAMVEAGKARFVSKETARHTLSEYKGRPIIISRVSGKYMEICRTWPKNCLYWNFEKRGLKCIQRPE